MSGPFRDDALDAMVRELNRSAGAGRTPEDPPPADEGPWPAAEVEAGDPLEHLLAEAVRREATDILLLPGMPPVLRVGGRLVATDAPPLDEEELRGMLVARLSAPARRSLADQGAADFSLHLAAGAGSRRFRVNLHRQRGRLAAAVRALPWEVPTLASLNLPASLAELVRPLRGLVLLCGPAGSGKTSTLAALVGEINRARTCHVITIEDPIEYEHPNLRSVIEQVEVGSDSPGFAEALRAALRQNPDVILVGEMRDLDSIAIALTAAETGHLVLSTLHTADAAQAVHRIVDVFPAVQQGQIRQQLALSLHAVVGQQLVPRGDGRGRVPAVEVLLATAAVRHTIRKDRVESLHNEITLGRRSGMVTMEDSLARLVRSGTVTLEEAQLRAPHPEELASLLG